MRSEKTSQLSHLPRAGFFMGVRCGSAAAAHQEVPSVRFFDFPTPRLLPDSPPQAARFATSGPVSASASNSLGRLEPRHSERLSSTQNFQKFSFRSFSGARRPNTSRDSVRVRFGKFSDMVFGNRLIVFGFRYATARLRRSIPGNRFRV
jgi:hypothetical protein